MSRFDSAPSPSRLWGNLAVLVLVAVVGALGYAYFRGGTPAIEPVDVPEAIGASRLVSFRIQAPAGVSSVEAHYRQAGKTIDLGRRTFSPRRWFSAGSAPQIVDFAVQAGRNQHSQLADGTATLVVTARAANLRGSQARWERSVAIRSTPPTVYALTTQAYLNQGGSTVVVYHVSPSASISGVQMAGDFFPGYALPNATAPGTMFCMFAFPWDAPTDSQPVLIARDAAGNQATAQLPVKTFPHIYRERKIAIDDAFIGRVVMPIIANTPGLKDQGSPLQDFLLVNRDLRRTDAQDLLEAAKKTVQQFLWHGVFKQLPNSKVEAYFADRRAYVYDGQVVDHETHLGYDLAAVRHTPVPAANSGRVIWTKYFGIYGNCVLIDHGYGLMSLYAHLNDFTVKPGDMVQQGQIIAHSDSTGLAGGDHLHYSMLIDGVQVNPVEWWDPHWVQGRISAPLTQFEKPAGGH